VLAPLADLAPGLRPPGWGETVAAARARRVSIEDLAAVRPVARWDRIAGAWEPPGEVGPVARDGSPVAVYLELPGDEEAALIHGALLDVGLPPDCEILELGCGAGRVTAPLSALGHRVVAVDQSEAMLAEVRRRVPHAALVLGDVESLNLGRRVAAVVLGSHLVNAEAGLGAAFLATCRRHVAPGGAVFIQAYDPDIDWAAATRRRTVAGAVAVTLLRADRTGNRLVGSVEYETRGGRWVQEFVATLLDENSLRAALDLTALRFERWIDRPAGWLVARPA
jgi:SAM-dependent methyltransferase